MFILIPVLLLISFVFYTIAVIDGSMFGTPEGEMDQIVADKLKEIIQTVEKEQQVTLGGAVSDTFDKVQLALKIVPSMDNHIYILKRMKLVGGPNSEYNGFEKDVSYDMNALGDQTVNPYFYEWNGAKTLPFPTFKFDSDNVPMGDSMRMCLGIEWIPIKKRSQFDQYLEVKGLDECELHASGKVYWESDYPTHGINFKLWDQSQKKGDTACSNGIYQ